MKKTSCLLLLSAALAMPVHAKVVSYRYTADIFSLNDFKDGNNNFVDSSTISGYTFSLGDQVRGMVSYDSDMPLASYQPYTPPYGTFLAYEGYVAMTYGDVKNDYRFTSTPSSDQGLIVENDSSYSGTYRFDGIGIYTTTDSADGSWQSLGMSLTDYYGNAFNSAAIPTTLDLNAFISKILNFNYVDANNKQLYVSSQLTSLSLVDDTAVPEPAGTALFAFGTAALFGTMRKRR